MEPVAFDVFMKKLIDDELKILATKGAEYARDNQDRLANFKRLAKLLGMPPLKVWAVYFFKHIDAILSFVEYGETKSEESIEGRFNDARNYLALGLGLVYDSRNESKETV